MFSFMDAISVLRDELKADRHAIDAFVAAYHAKQKFLEYLRALNEVIAA